MSGKERNIILYFGLIQFEKENSMCQRASGIKNLIIKNGYIPVLVGVSDYIRNNYYDRIDKNNYVIKSPSTLYEWICSCMSAGSIIKVINSIGKNRIKAIIFADYRFFPTLQIVKFCKCQDIHFVADIMDWFVYENDLHSFIKAVDNLLRIKFIYTKVQRRIYICSKYCELLGKTDKTVIIPGTCEINRYRKINSCKTDKKKIVLSFAGKVDSQRKKERIDWVIKALKTDELSGKYVFYIAGIDIEQYLSENRDMYRYLSKDVKFLGEIRHIECIELLKKSDFSVVVRPNNRLCNYGFSTKIGESFACGIPVLATDTSDNKKYIKNGQNGYVCGCSYKEVYKMLLKVSRLDERSISRLKSNVIRNNPLVSKGYIEELRTVIE